MTPAGNYNEIIKALSLCGITARDIQLFRRSQWLRCLRCGSTAARLLESQVRIPP
jgi:hypothetical protein